MFKKKRPLDPGQRKLQNSAFLGDEDSSSKRKIINPLSQRHSLWRSEDVKASHTNVLASDESWPEKKPNESTKKETIL